MTSVHIHDICTEFNDFIAAILTDNFKFKL